jgi:peptidoglycan/LPS O-acetylase OafA/YrhL
VFGRVNFAGPLAHPWLVHVGTVSYSLYLFHPVAASMVPQGGAANFTIAIGMAIALATGIYHLLEVPGRRLIRFVADLLLGIDRSQATLRTERAPAE